MSDLYQWQVWSCAAYVDGEQRVLVVDDTSSDERGRHVVLSCYGDGGMLWEVRLSPEMARGLAGALVASSETDGEVLDE